MFSEKYTTAEKISKEEDFVKLLSVEETESFSKDVSSEKTKIIISNDAMAIGELLELYINTVRNK